MIHYSFVGYMIASAIVLIVCAMAYRLLLEDKVRPSVNRLILLSIYAISFLIPLLIGLIPSSQIETGIEIGTPEFGGVIRNINGEQKGMTLSLPEIVLWISRIYFIGLFFTFTYSVLAIWHLVNLLRKSKSTIVAGSEVFVHDNKKLSSFSWGDKIFLYVESLNSEYKDLQMLVSHEKAHLDKGHWIDLALAQVVLIFQWFNPAAWFMKRELQRIHEYEADEAVLKSGTDEKEYQMLLIQNISGSRYSGLTDGLNNCSLKKRIIMMKKTKFKKDWVIRGIAVCGFAILGGAIIHIPAIATVLEDSPNLSERIEKTIVINGETKDEKREKDVEYYIDGINSRKEKLVSLDTSNIKEMKIDKSSETPKVEITTKKAQDFDNIDKTDFSELKDNIDKIDFSEFKKKGLVENFPDAYGATDKIAEYEGGQLQLLKDLMNTIQYPEEAKEQNIQGKVVVRFQVNTNGTLSNCEVAYSQNPILNEAALKAIENLPRKWEPGEVDGKPVASIMNIPVTFSLQSSKEESK